MEIEKMYTTKEAAELLRVKQQTIRYYIMRGQLTPLKGVNGRNLIPESEIERVLTGHTPAQNKSKGNRQSDPENA